VWGFTTLVSSLQPIRSMIKLKSSINWEISTPLSLQVFLGPLLLNLLKFAYNVCSCVGAHIGSLSLSN
jgi:hypothetical protein